jgi:hypothetical protein
VTGNSALSDRATARAADALRAMDYIKRGRGAPKALYAAGLRVQPGESRATLRAIAALKQPWQRLAWNYRDMIGELRFALQYRARAISRMHFYIAELPSGPEDEPIPVALRSADDPEVAKRVTLPEDLCAAAEAELARLPLDTGMSFLGMWSENFDVAGECWLYGYADEDGTEHWAIKSALEIDVSPDGSNVYMIDATSPGGRRKLDLSEEGREELYRLWVPHPVNGTLSDSALRASLDTLEDIVSIGREMRAATRSRFSANGVWMLPFGMFLPDGTKSETDPTDPESNPFAARLTSAILSPITNEGDAGAMAPIILTGTRDDIEAAKDGFMRFDREDSPSLVGRLQAALTRMGNSLDIPPEVITGMAEVNHWTAWQIDASTAKHHIEPSARLMVDSLTTVFVRAALLKQGFPPALVNRLRVWFALGTLTENPNRRQDALDAHDRGAIGNKSLRDALGFGEEDAPGQSELLAMIAMKNGIDTAWAAQILAWYAEQEEGTPLDGLPMPPSAPVGGGPAALPSASPGPRDQGNPTGGVPRTAPPVIAASATPYEIQPDVLAAAAGPSTTLADVQSGQTQPAYRLALADFTELLSVERRIRDRLAAECDKAISRAIERAGSRLRSKISRDRDASMAVKDVPSGQLCAHVGRQQALALADLPFLLNEAFAGLRDTYMAIVTGGIYVLLARLGKALRMSKDETSVMAQRLQKAMAERYDSGWDYLDNALRARTERLMFGTDQDADPGEEFDTLVQPSVVRASLSIIGGLPETATGVDERGRGVGPDPLGGLANGETVRAEVEQQGGVDVGYTWVYGITLKPDRFEPHWELEAERFEGWADPKLSTAGSKYAFVGPFYRPGDHEGCMCDYVSAWALPAYAAQVDERLRMPTEAMSQLLVLAEGDDRAGRTGTTAQYQRQRWQEIQELQSRFIKGDA